MFIFGILETPLLFQGSGRIKWSHPQEERTIFLWAFQRGLPHYMLLIYLSNKNMLNHPNHNLIVVYCLGYTVVSGKVAPPIHKSFSVEGYPGNQPIVMLSPLLFTSSASRIKVFIEQIVPVVHPLVLSLHITFLRIKHRRPIKGKHMQIPVQLLSLTLHSYWYPTPPLGKVSNTDENCDVKLTATFKIEERTGNCHAVGCIRSWYSAYTRS